MIDRNVQASLLAYKAYEIGRDATVRKKTGRAVRLVSACISQLATKGETEETLRRRVFYTLIRAEILRTSDPVPDRTKAKEIGERLKKNGCIDPFGLYMKIIEVTTNKATAGNYGDMTTRTSPPVQNSESFRDRFGNEIHIDKAAAAVSLAPAEMTRHQKFLHMRLEDIIRLHKLELH